ncbi:DMT family transporter [Companilactobacillus baiquanensis]|uniref:DMT family transporter n=1 Tax=Companilactobacillus baiquanensis TaxID=2486005 RepID=A0ABW1UW26_9LACO|nr:DMT family transporter [Companilactobacillus baiquanensis]
MLAIAIGLIIGIGLPLQTSINSRLKIALGSPFLASLTSFTIGTILLAIITLIIDHGLFFPIKLFVQQPIWLWIGGIFGVTYLTANILLFPKLGSVQTVIMPILGQIVMGLLIDNFGLFYSLKSPLTITRFFGAILVLLGVIGAVSINELINKRHHRMDSESSGLFIWRMFGVIAGMLGAAQSAINGHLGAVLNSTVKAAFLSFFVGTICILLIVIFIHPKLQLNKAKNGNPWWMWIGGIIGGLYILGNVYLVPIIGTGLSVVIILLGLMIGSLIIDQFGILESKRNPVTVAQVLSLLVMISGVALIRLF